MKQWCTKHWRAGLISAAVVLATSTAPALAQANNTPTNYSGGTNIEALTLDYYMPSTLNVTFDERIPTPREVLGYEVGQWHVRHDQLVRYFEILAEHSDRITLEETGRTHEQRPLIIAKVSAAQNKDRLEEMREAHMA